MDLEELNKAQIVLLTLLVSFMTSIATGIVTVTLLDQAPPAITQNISRVVERTVERVVPADDAQTANAVTTTEKTVVVKESDLITESIDTNAKSLVRIIRKAATVGGTDQLVGLGVFVTKGGLIATDSSIIVDGATYEVRTQAGNTFTTAIENAGTGKATALLRVLVDESGETEFAPVTFAQDLSVLKLGQTIISLSGGERTNVSIGIVSAVDTTPLAEGEEDEEGAIIRGIRTDIDQNRILYGSPLVDLFGEVVGIHTAAAQNSDTSAGYTPVSVVQAQMAQSTETQ